MKVVKFNFPTAFHPPILRTDFRNHAKYRATTRRLGNRYASVPYHLKHSDREWLLPGKRSSRRAGLVDKALWDSWTNSNRKKPNAGIDRRERKASNTKETKEHEKHAIERPCRMTCW